MSLPVADDVVVASDEVEANIIFLTVKVQSGSQVETHQSIPSKNLPSIDAQSGHNEPRASLLLTNIDFLLDPSRIRTPLLHHHGGIDRNLRIKVGRIDPIAREVLWQRTLGRDNFRFDGDQPKPLGPFLRGLERIALGSDGHGNVLVIVTIGQLNRKGRMSVK